MTLPALADESAKATSENAIESGAPRTFRLCWARSPAEVEQAQRLRFRVFARELGARLHTPAGTPDGHDADAFDPHCAHLLVRAVGNEQHGEVIATCRVLLPEAAQRARGLYSQGEFDLAPLRALLPQALEMGRVCVHPQWRRGMVVMAIWRELGQLLVRRGLQVMIGCSSVGLADGGELARHMWHALQGAHLAPPGMRVAPHRPLPLGEAARFTDAAPPDVPPLIKGYLRLGGRLLGPPALDEAFNTADFPMMMRVADMPARYSRRIFGA
ncbi:MAG: GNAT family N-acetyltransferase [Ramlibacter sp.]